MGTASTVLASDFSNSTKDVLRHRWTLAKLQALIANLEEDATVVITVDDSTGFALVGAKLIEAFWDGPARGDRVTIEHEGARPTHYPANNIGSAITVVAASGSSRAKWAALEQYRGLRSKAIRQAMVEWDLEAGTNTGTWQVTPLSLTEASVLYKPSGDDLRGETLTGKFAI